MAPTIRVERPTMIRTSRTKPGRFRQERAQRLWSPRDCCAFATVDGARPAYADLSKVRSAFGI